MTTWDLQHTKNHLFICNGGSCNHFGAEALTQAIRKEISHREAEPLIHTTRTQCNGRCKDKCVVIHYPKGTWYKNVTPEDVPLFIKSILEDTNYLDKVSHTYQGVFQRQCGIEKGFPKNDEFGKKSFENF
ncbi:ferredoxin [Alteribacillus sp. HJP-4]|uniref:(2Fe-2S) ferredoxin domain-containing protein n=1 Tax=Alteribacillus sp. HJP-4 TaxID=2775394 RepID=UPI0035CD1B11